MAKFNTDTLSLFHTFSKTQVNSDANKPQFSSLGNTVNKSGHTVQSNEIWTEAIPFFGLGVPADFSSTAQVNDLVKDADGVIWQRNATPYNGSTGTYWTQKTKSITSFTKGADGKYTFTEVDGALVDGSYLLNAAGVPTVKYHAKKQLTPLVSDNNAFIDSEKDASRLKIDGKWVDQFIGVTDVYVNGSAAVSYAPVLFSNSSSTTPLKAGAGEDYLDYCATGIILWDKSECTGNEVISCFEYVGTKLDTSLSDIRKDVQDIIGTTMEGVVASVTASDAAKSAGIDVDSSTKTSPKITLTTGSVAAGVTKLVTGDAVNTAIKNAIDAIPEVQAATTEVAGVVTISTNDAIAIDATSTAAATVAAVAATRSEIAEEMGALTLAITSAQGAAQEAAASATASATAAQNAQTAAQSAQSASETAASNATASASAASQSATSASNAETAAKAAQTAAEGSAASATASETAAKTAQQQATASAQSAAQAATDAKAAKDFVEALTIPEVSTVNSSDQLDINDHVIEVKKSTFTAETGTSTSIGTMTANENGLATGATVVAVANDALRAAKAYSNSLHTTSVTYHVTDTLPTVPAGKEEEYKGRIYLVLTGVDGVVAADGDRIEYMYVQENGVWGWEQIGTTTADLADYAKTADLNVTNVGSGAVKVSQTDGKVSSVTVATEALVSNGAIKTSVTDANALVKAGDALAAIKLAKPENYVASVTGYTTAGEAVTTTQGAAIIIKDGRDEIYPADLWGTTVNINNNVITVNGGLINASYWADPYSSDKKISLDSIWDDGNTYIVDNNKLLDNNGNILANIKTDELISGQRMFCSVALTSFNDDLGSLVNGIDMFHSTALTSFDGNLGSLVCGYNMFASTALTSFNGDLGSLINGDHMFASTALTSFDSDLSSLVDAKYMFNNTALTSFDSDLSSLVEGQYMFSTTSSLTSFTNDLSSLVEGSCMFEGSKITSFNGDLSSLVKAHQMFKYVPLTSFTSDLSSLVEGYEMFTNVAFNVESIEIICDSLPEKSKLQSWDKNNNIYKPYTSGEFIFKYKTTDFNDGWAENITNATSGVKSVIALEGISAGAVCSIHIKYSSEGLATLTDDDKATITALFEETAQRKGWTIITNAELGGTYTPTVTMTDGTIQRYIYAIKHEADEKTANYVDANGKYWTVDTAEAIIGPNVKYWSLFATVEDAITEWGLSEYTYVEPAEEA